MEFPDNPELYEVGHGILFPILQGVKEHLHCVRKGKEKATPPPPPPSL